MRRIFFKNTAVIAIFVIVIICVYLVVRTVAFSNSARSFFDWSLGLLLLLSEAFVLIHTIGYMLEVIRLRGHKEINRKTLDFKRSNAPRVAVVVSAKNEPKNILMETFTTLAGINYPNKAICLIDDSTEEKYHKEAIELGKFFKIKVFRHRDHEGAKAGALNDFTKNVDAKYLAVFDSDQHPMPDFLNQTVSILERRPKVAFVQTPQFYHNLGDSPIAMGASMQQAIFYENICEGKDRSNAMFCCGTNVVFRLEALKSIGGFDEYSITEDFSTSLRLQANGWDSVYYNHVSAFGLAPETLPAYFKQQTRWATGTISVFRKIALLFLTQPKKMRLTQWWEYFLSGTYYFMGWAYFIFMICPIIFLIFSVPSYFLLPQIYIAAYIPYMVMAVVLFYSTLSERQYSLKQIYLGSIMGNISFPILMKAAVYGLAGKKMSFQVTKKGKIETATFSVLWPYYTMIAIGSVAIGFGVGKIVDGGNAFAYGINIFWAVYHIFLLSNIVYLNQSQKTSKTVYDKISVKELSGE